MAAANFCCLSPRDRVRVISTTFLTNSRLACGCCRCVFGSKSFRLLGLGWPGRAGRVGPAPFQTSFLTPDHTNRQTETVRGTREAPQSRRTDSTTHTPALLRNKGGAPLTLHAHTHTRTLDTHTRHAHVHAHARTRAASPRPPTFLTGTVTVQGYLTTVPYS